MKHNPDHVPEMEEDTKPLFLTRNFEGFFQYLDTLSFDGDERYCWRFYIEGFSFDDKYGHIKKWAGGYDLVSFNESDHVLVGEKFYSHKYWNH